MAARWIWSPLGREDITQTGKIMAGVVADEQRLCEHGQIAPEALVLVGPVDGVGKAQQSLGIGGATVACKALNDPAIDRFDGFHVATSDLPKRLQAVARVDDGVGRHGARPQVRHNLFRVKRPAVLGRVDIDMDDTHFSKV